jgi:DNA invertase Pin-like site-specific DNA recombinase
MSTKTFRCAVYTRKSSDEGLEQSFNSLDAQREAGEAYVRSQTSEGWSLLPVHYDDGGFSGGTMERPGLQRLLTDIAAGQIDIVVVYKIDRLTRSLADFARIVEVFEAAGTSFVSVTQAFNTTTSMGRLMLNVLLSFAQFEREVTGERIRDKIAASKAKGMWMGGILPLGYDLPAAGTRTLIVNEGEAATVRHIFSRYLALGSVHALQRELEAQRTFSKLRTSCAGVTAGGLAFSRGALLHLLRNQLYLGRIVHKGQVYAGEPMSPTLSRGKSGRVYRYYVSASLQQGRGKAADGLVQRLPAPTIERLVGEVLCRWLPLDRDALCKLGSVRVMPTKLMIDLIGVRPAHLVSALQDREELVHHEGTSCTVSLPLILPVRGGRRRIETSSKRTARPDPTLIAALRKAHGLLDRDRGKVTLGAAPVSPYDRRILRLAFLAPDLQRDILTGQQPQHLNLKTLMKIALPLAWSQQRIALAWA